MAARETADAHAGRSDPGPSSKDPQPGAAGGDIGDDVQPSGNESAHGPGSDVQPGTGTEGTSWQSREPDPHDEDDKLNQALKDSFPASDPPQAAQPGVTGWDIKGR